ncbi:NYN domain-containing protein [Candidatus Omnitrophota bacterium]
MSSYLIVDGYNLIHKWPRLKKEKQKNIESACAKLFFLIQQFCDFQHIEGVIVYDGKGAKRKTYAGRPTVIYSQKNETADSVIEEMVYNASDKTKIRVVTDDRVVTNMVLGMGGTVTATDFFERDLNDAIASLREMVENKNSHDWTANTIIEQAPFNRAFRKKKKPPFLG